jgi:hypothetical protein
VLAVALGACDGHRDGAPSAGGAADSLGRGAAVPISGADSVRAGRMGYWVAAKAYLDGWQASGTSLEHASGVSDTTRDADVASAFVLGKATEEHLFEAFEKAAMATAAAAERDTSIERRIRALHFARRNTLVHYQAFLSDGTAEELELAKEGYEAEVAIATPLGEDLKAALARVTP